ncbi:flagella synthesis protein FlgN [Halomonas nitroreducens]|uniref:Flagellar protein FlgN n=1 Tax=Halomonas nitroreducens TaxID=447425 RepID=A0A3S0HQC8_9GAMM|nr:flagellar protein FlgN [Halomonas nitroreducens]RTR04379.1 flagellar protein FlgN [Halomonas nitroreducens]
MSLQRLLDDQQSRLAALSRLLEAEQALLVEGEVDGKALNRIADDKTGLLQALENTERLRTRVQQQLGYPPGSEGARQAAQDAGCLPAWEAMLDAGREIARLNERNGRLLTLRMTHNQQMLDYLHRLADPDVYAANGRTGLQPRRLNARA